MEGFGQKLGGLGAFGKVAAVGLAGVAAAGIGLVAGLTGSIGQAMDFEAAMSAVGAVAGATDAEMQTLSDTALKLGQDTTLSGIGATDAARAMRELAAAGLSVEDIVGGGALGALRLASAGGIDVARAAEIAAMALAGFGLEGSEAARVADLFAGAANSSAISVDDIAETMKYVAPIAKTMGLSIEEVTATIAALGNQGIKGSQAGTSLRSMIVSLAKPSKEASKVMRDLGLSFFDSNGEMKNLAGISDELKTKLSGLTDKQRASALATLFGNEALTAATVLYGEGADGINKWLEEVTTGATAAEVGAQRNNNLKGSIEALKSSLETAQIVLGKAFLPALKGIVDQMALGVSAAIPLIEAWGPKLVAGITAAIGVITSFGGYVTSAITAIVGAFQKLQSGEITLAQFIGGVKALIATVLGDIGGLLGQAATFIAPYLAAIGSAITAALPIIGGAIGSLASALGGWIQATAIPYLITNLPLWRDAIVAFITADAIPTIVGGVVGIGNALGSWIGGTAIPYLTTNLPLWKDAIVAFIANDVIPTVVGAVVGIGNAMATWITTTAIPYLITNLPLWKDALINFIVADAVPTVQSAVVGIANAMSDWITTQLIPRINEKMPTFAAALAAQILASQETINKPAEDMGRQIGERLGEGLVIGGVAGITKAVSSWQSALQVLMLTSLPVALVTAGNKLGPLLAEWITNPGIPEMVKHFAEFELATGVAILRMVAPLQLIMFQVGIGVVEGLLNGIKGKAGELWAWFSALPGKLRDFTTGAVAEARSIGSDIVSGLIAGLLSRAGEVAASAASIVTNALQAARNAIQSKSPSRKFMELGRDAIEGLIIGMDEKQGEAAKKAADVASAVAKGATDILGAIGAVAGYSFAGGSPSGETLGWFRHLAESIVQTLADVATTLGTTALDNAKKVAESVGQIGSAVKSTLEGFKALAEYDFTKGSPTGDAMGWFRHLMESIVLNFAQAAQLVGTEGMTQATAFAKTMNDVVTAGKGALELFAKLKDFKDIPSKALDELFKALETTLEFSGQLVSRSDEIKQNALEYLANMQAAFAAYQLGSSFAVGGGVSLSAPAGVGSGGSTGGGGERGPKGDTYTINVQGNVLDGADFQDKVVSALDTAGRRGRS